MDAIEIKRGDSFDYGVILPDEFADGYFVGWTVASQLPLLEWPILSHQE